MPFVSPVLIIGKPRSGKTTFFAQLYLRILKQKSNVTLWKAAKNIKAIEDAVRRLARGEEPQSTPADSNEELKLPVLIDDLQLELICPDYGGEQVSGMIELMEYDEKWRQRVAESDHWLLFIRPGPIVNYYDLSNAGYEKLEKKRSEGQLQSPLSEQCQLIELLQALVYIKGSGMKRRLEKPSLLIALTCWDELNTAQAPQAYTQQELPLLHDFITANWEQQAYQFFGLSAQGFALHEQGAKDKYLEELPENFGYLVMPDGTRTNDITLLVKAAMQ